MSIFLERLHKVFPSKFLFGKQIEIFKYTGTWVQEVHSNQEKFLECQE